MPVNIYDNKTGHIPDSGNESLQQLLNSQVVRQRSISSEPPRAPINGHGIDPLMLLKNPYSRKFTY